MLKRIRCGAGAGKGDGRGREKSRAQPLGDAQTDTVRGGGWKGGRQGTGEVKGPAFWGLGRPHFFWNRLAPPRPRAPARPLTPPPRARDYALPEGLGLSAPCVALLRRLLEPDESLRIGMDEIMQVGGG
jgi:hypothetical protein